MHTLINSSSSSTGALSCTTLPSCTLLHSRRLQLQPGLISLVFSSGCCIWFGTLQCNVTDSGPDRLVDLCLLRILGARYDLAVGSNHTV